MADGGLGGRCHLQIESRKENKKDLGKEIRVSEGKRSRRRVREFESAKVASILVGKCGNARWIRN